LPAKTPGQVVGDISQAAAALPYLDADLAAALPADDPARDQPRAHLARSGSARRH
jgi:hypothetical protein